MRKQILLILVVVDFVVLHHMPVYAITFPFTRFDVPGANYTIPVAINNTGQIIDTMLVR